MENYNPIWYTLSEKQIQSLQVELRTYQEKHVNSLKSGELFWRAQQLVSNGMAIIYSVGGLGIISYLGYDIIINPSPDISNPELVLVTGLTCSAIGLVSTLWIDICKAKVEKKSNEISKLEKKLLNEQV